MFIENKWEYELLPPPEIEQTELDGKRHYYCPDGTLYPSVTTVLSSLENEGIKNWEKRVGKEEANRIRTRATNHGTSVHELAEHYVRGNLINYSKYMPTAVSAFKSIVPTIDKIDSIYGIEHPLYSHRLKTAGRTDLLCSLYGLNTVMDFKTSRKEKKIEYIHNYFLQTTCYALMAYELYNIKFKQIAIVIAVEDGPPQVFVKLIDEYVQETISVFKNYYK